MVNHTCLQDDLRRSNPAEPLQGKLLDEKFYTSWLYYNTQLKQLQLDVIYYYTSSVFLVCLFFVECLSEGSYACETYCLGLYVFSTAVMRTF